MPIWLSPEKARILAAGGTSYQTDRRTIMKKEDNDKAGNVLRYLADGAKALFYLIRIALVKFDLD